MCVAHSYVALIRQTPSFSHFASAVRHIINREMERASSIHVESVESHNATLFVDCKFAPPLDHFNGSQDLSQTRFTTQKIMWRPWACRSLRRLQLQIPRDIRHIT